MREDRSEDVAAKSLSGARRSAFGGLWRRLVLTWRYQGPRAVVVRALASALPRRDPVVLAARRWYAQHGKRVTIVIVGPRESGQLERCVGAIRRTTREPLVRIVCLDTDAGELTGVELIGGDAALGATAQLNRALDHERVRGDVIVLDAGTVVRTDWLAVLQHAVRARLGVGAAGPQVVDARGAVLAAGLARQRITGALTPRYRDRPPGFGPADVAVPVVALTRDCIYFERGALVAVGELDPQLALSDALAELCLRFWQRGVEVHYAPAALVERTRPEPDVLAPRPTFRPAGASAGALPIVYVTESTVVGGGHRDIFEHLNRLAARGRDALLFTLGDPPDWFDLKVPVETFSGYDELVAALAPLEAIKVATWWATAEPVFRASIVHGVPVYFVQDIETSYYPDDERARFGVLASYREEFAYVTISEWNRERLGELGLDAKLIPPGVDHATFRPRPETERRDDMLLAIGRGLPLKNLRLTLDGWRALPPPRPELRLFGSEPKLASETGISYEHSPSDERVGELFCEATLFVQSSAHEGFCLPLLEAMASGAPVVCTDAHGNRDFCVDGENCLMVRGAADDLSRAIERLLGDAPLRERLAAGGLETAATYAWEPRIDELEGFLAALVKGQALPSQR